MSEALNRGAARARLATLALLVALVIASLLAAVWGERSAVAFWTLVVFLIAPLVLALPGLLRPDRRTYAWATLCVTPHFIYALTEIIANPAIRGLVIAILLLSLALAITLVVYLRLTRPTAAS